MKESDTEREWISEGSKRGECCRALGLTSHSGHCASQDLTAHNLSYLILPSSKTFKQKD
jgi:hypothetical protein